jgi:4-diphosphocytidyl-2-C-methyl-D-erythritol kinase
MRLLTGAGYHRSMRVRSYAKINWALRITGKRPDRYHDLETLFQTISLHDVLTFERADRLELTCTDASIPTDETNLVIRAARELDTPPVAIHLEKQIPAGGGLGGGSSNAAATLRALDAMFELQTSPERLQEIALSLGSDVPFFLTGGTAYATGRGEIVTPMQSSGPIPLLVALPKERVVTADAFRDLRTFSQPLGLDRYRGFVENGLLSHRGNLINDFEEVVFERLPTLRALKQQMQECGAAWSSMSGSGSTIVGAFRTPAERDAARSRFRDVRVVTASCIEGAESLANIESEE